MAKIVLRATVVFILLSLNIAPAGASIIDGVHKVDTPEILGPAQYEELRVLVVEDIQSRLLAARKVYFQLRYKTRLSMSSWNSLSPERKDFNVRIAVYQLYTAVRLILSLSNELSEISFDFPDMYYLAQSWRADAEEITRDYREVFRFEIRKQKIQASKKRP